MADSRYHPRMALARLNGHWLGSVVLVAVSLLAGCGNKDGGTNATADTATAKSTAAPTNTAAAVAVATADATAAPTGEATADATASPSADATAKTADNTQTAKPDGDKPSPDAPDEPDEPVAAASASASAAPAEAAGKHFGDKQVEPMYAAWLQSGGRYVVGKAASAQAVVIAKGEYKCNDNYPYKFKLKGAPEGLSFPNPVSRAVTKSKARAVVSIPFTPTSAGKKTISGTFYFSVCNDSTCKIAKKPVSMTVTVHES